MGQEERVMMILIKTEELVVGDKILVTELDGDKHEYKATVRSNDSGNEIIVLTPEGHENFIVKKYDQFRFKLL
jgi:hypothetical protein